MILEKPNLYPTNTHRADLDRSHQSKNLYALTTTDIEFSISHQNHPNLTRYLLRHTYVQFREMLMITPQDSCRLAISSFLVICENSRPIYSIATHSIDIKRDCFYEIQTTTAHEIYEIRKQY